MIEILWADPASAAVVAGLFGLLVGSFLNVVILRLPPRLEWQWRQDAREVLGLAPAYEPAPGVSRPNPPAPFPRREGGASGGAYL